MITNQKEIDRIFDLFCSLMEKNIFLIQGIDLQKIAELCICSSLILEEALIVQLGFSFKQTVALYRIQYARELLSIGIRYGIVYKYSGFSSKKELEKAMESIVN